MKIPSIVFLCVLAAPAMSQEAPKEPPMSQAEILDAAPDYERANCGASLKSLTGILEFDARRAADLKMENIQLKRLATKLQAENDALKKSHEGDASK